MKLTRRERKLRVLLRIFAEDRLREASNVDELNDWLESGGFQATDYMFHEFVDCLIGETA